ncbi:MAG: O-antigen ligase family protein [Anaerolineae bacterium]|nr:O-antigen ligase family protein [Anaerolineae bacterium]
METKLSRWCSGFIEAGWLAAVIVVPLFFNIHSDRVFEPDKLTLLRSIALMMSVAWIVRFVDRQEWRDLGRLHWRTADSIWRLPFVLPVFVLVIIYLISTVFSVTPGISWAGSYQRLQGTYTTLAYVVVFALLATTVRTRSQVRRVITMVIVTSIPVALYGVLQKQQWDPLPWGGDTSIRIAGHMGNAIFIGAYLIMVIPLTLTRIIEAFSNILTDENLSLADVTRSSIYIFALAVQLLALFWTQSRGPWIGLGVGLFTFVLIALVGLRNATRDQRRYRVADLLWPAVFFFAGLIGLFVSSAIARSAGATSSLLVFVGLVGVMFLLILIFAAARIGWRWLWLGWISLALLVALTLLLGNILHNPDDSADNGAFVDTLSDTFNAWGEVPGIGRLFRLLEDDRSTGKVRILIWEGALDLITPHDPLQYPDGSSDTFNFLRPLIGYGPESMYVAYNSFYPPELGTVEARNASPDRSHNETFDALVITGIVGFVAWQVLYLSVFYYGFKWLGVVRSSSEGRLLIALWIIGALVALIGFVLTKGWEYLGVAIPFGSIGGLVVYLIYYALFAQRDPEGDGDHNNFGRTLLLVGLLSALIAYYVEIHFGIAIAATRLHSFVYIGLLLVIGRILPAEEAEAVVVAQATRKRRRRASVALPTGWISPAVGYGLLLALFMGTLLFGFINFTPMPGELENIQSVSDLPSAGQILYRALFVHPQRDFQTAPFLFGMVLLSWLFASLIIVSEMIKGGELSVSVADRQRAAVSTWIVVAFLALVVGLFYGLIQAGLLRGSFIAPTNVAAMSEVQRRVAEAERIGRYLTVYYLFAFTMIFGAGVAFVWNQTARLKQWGSVPGWVTAPVLVIVGLILINLTNLNIVQADMIYKRGKPFDSQAPRLETPEQQRAAWDNAIGIYEKAISLTPAEDFYYLWLGRALLEKSSVVPESERPELLEVARQELLIAQETNPLNTDHTANLARLNVRWASVTDGAEREAHVADAERYYRDALELSPQNSIIRNELATMYLGLEGDCEQALMALEESAEIDPFYSVTSVTLSDAYRRCSAEQTEADRQEYLDQAEAWADIALTQPAERGRTRESIATDVTQLYLRLANTNSEAGAFDEALRLAEKALTIASDSEQQTITDFIDQLNALNS